MTTTATAIDYYAWYTAMRNAGGVAYDENQHIWNVFKYDDVKRALSDTSTFLSHVLPGAGFVETSLLMTDPPRHRQLRGLLAQAFTPRRIALLEPRISAIVDSLLDAVIESGQMDVIEGLSYPLPLTIICELLGIPVSDRIYFGHWAEVVIAEFAKMQGKDAEAQQKLGEYFLEMMVQRRREPQDDLISGLLAAQVDGEYLTDHEIQSFCVLLLIAGSETTRNLIGNAIYCLDRHPEALTLLQANPSLVPAALEEVTRFYTPVKFVLRVTATATTIAGHEIPAGQMVMLWIASANRDESRYPHADQFDIQRVGQPHVGFGHGMHFCLGAPLARIEANIALTVMLKRLGNMRLNPTQSLEPIESPQLQGFQQVPLLFQPGQRLVR